MRHGATVAHAAGSRFFAEFSTEHLAEPIAVGLYTNALRSPFEQSGHAGLDVSGLQDFKPQEYDGNVGFDPTEEL